MDLNLAQSLILYLIDLEQKDLHEYHVSCRTASTATSLSRDCRTYRMYQLSPGRSSGVLKRRKVPHVDEISTMRRKSPTMALRVWSSYSKSEKHSSGTVRHVRHIGQTAAGSSRGRLGGSPKETSPTITQLRTLFFHAAVPMVGFGEYN